MATKWEEAKLRAQRARDAERARRSAAAHLGVMKHPDRARVRSAAGETWCALCEEWVPRPHVHRLDST